MRVASTAGLAILIGFVGIAPSNAMDFIQDTGSNAEESVPAGLIVVKIQEAEPDADQNLAIKPEIITDRRHPAYVRCRIEPVAGSIMKKRRICMSNRDWKIAIRRGNQYATDFVADNQPGFFVP